MKNKIRKEILDELLAGYSGPEDMSIRWLAPVLDGWPQTAATS